MLSDPQLYIFVMPDPWLYIVVPDPQLYIACPRSPSGGGGELDLWSEPSVFGSRAVFQQGPPAHLHVTNPKLIKEILYLKLVLDEA